MLCGCSLFLTLKRVLITLKDWRFKSRECGIVDDSSDRQWRDDCRVFWKINLSVVDQINWNGKSREAGKDSYKPILKALNIFSEASHKATHRRDMLSFADISSLFPKENNTPEYPASFKTANLVLFGMLSLFLTMQSAPVSEQRDP